MAPALKGRSVSRRRAVAILGSSVAASVLATTGEARRARTPPPKACKDSTTKQLPANLLCVICCREAADVITRGHHDLSSSVPDEKVEKGHLDKLVDVLEKTKAARTEHALIVFDLDDKQLESVSNSVQNALAGKR